MQVTTAHENSVPQEELVRLQFIQVEGFRSQIQHPHY